MIVEVHGIPVWTRVRFPPGPFIVVRRDPSKMGGFLITQADAHERSSYIIASATYVVVRRDPSKMGGFLITQADAHERSSCSMASAIFV